MPQQPADAGRAAALLDFWFGPPDAPDRHRSRPAWFAIDATFDDALRRAFADDQRRAAAGLFDHWTAAAESCLALVLLLDQLPRNLYRGVPAAFASDAKARAVAEIALARGHDAAVPPVWRWFFYLPFEHSETLDDQVRSVALFAGLPENADNAEANDAARRHYEIIARFGRFPHRNQALSRPSTPEETAFLRLPNSSF